MKIVVNTDRCEGNATCMRAAPQVFFVDEQDVMHVLIEHPDESLREQVERAVKRCPKQALSLEPE